MLAVRPFKKPELVHRLINEGLRDRERGLITIVLKSIADLGDNTYKLKRRIWNDVNDNWSFYTEQDKASLKRRKPQNLTPPLSSDGGSSTSGQSPTSTHNGSPPPPVKRPSVSGPEKYTEPAGKKQRISHCSGSSAAQAQATRRMATTSSGGGASGESSTGGSASNGTSATSGSNGSAKSSSSSAKAGGATGKNGRKATGGSGASSNAHKQQRRPVVDTRESANLNPRSREAGVAAAPPNGGVGAANRVSSPMMSGYNR